jgi:hypothetical protein
VDEAYLCINVSQLAYAVPNAIYDHTLQCTCVWGGCTCGKGKTDDEVQRMKHDSERGKVCIIIFCGIAELGYKACLCTKGAHASCDGNVRALLPFS